MRQEWNAIYASYRSKSLMSGMVIGVDQHILDVTDKKTRLVEKRELNSLIVVNYRIKILIPETELWIPGDERPAFAARSMVGSKIEYVILEVDREGECAIASRRMALGAKRHFFSRDKHTVGEKLTCRMLAVGAKLCSVECNGYDMVLTQRDLSYTSIADLRERYHPGQELTCILKYYDAVEGKMEISVKEVNPNPFVNADIRHPVGSRRQAVISGKYAGGVFCTLPDDIIVLCLYCAQHSDIDFCMGDTVILVILYYDYSRELIYGKILSKW